MIAIHNRPGSFSDQWIEYCDNKKIEYKIVDCYSSDIIKEIVECNALMWHIHLNHPKDILFAKQLIYAIEQAGTKSFPDFNTVWHYDDKIGQKYLLESINAPFVNTYVFYDKKEALEWSEKTSYPKVFKLRGGAGSSNVHLAETEHQAKKLINKSFSKGFKQRNSLRDLTERYRKYKLGQATLKQILGGIFRLVIAHDYEKIKGVEIGYAYFQDFIPDNNHDIRIIVIDGKAFGIKRMVREGDFRASGSGLLSYDKISFDTEVIKIALEIAKELKLQSFAVDFIFNNGNPEIIEMSYAFPNKNFIEGCTGYWDEQLNFHEGEFNPYGWMVEMINKSSN